VQSAPPSSDGAAHIRKIAIAVSVSRQSSLLRGD
jgi:hypothetical protein